MLGFAYPGVTFTADLGYTGLTLNPLSYIFMTQADAAAQGNSSNFFGSPRIVGRLQALLPGLFLRQDLTLTVLFQQDLRSLVANSNLVQPGQTTVVYGQGGSLDSEYFGAGLSGAIVENLYYKGYAYLETGRTLSYVTSIGSYQYEPILALLAGIGAHYYMESLLHSTFGVDFLFASGDSNYTQAVEGDTSGGYATAFVPITSAPRILSLAYAPNIENIIATTFSYAIPAFCGREEPAGAPEPAGRRESGSLPSSEHGRRVSLGRARARGRLAEPVGLALESLPGKRVRSGRELSPFSDTGRRPPGGDFRAECKRFCQLLGPVLRRAGLQPEFLTGGIS